MELYQQNILRWLKSVSGKNANRLDRQTFGGISSAHVLVDTQKSGKETGSFVYVYCTKLVSLRVALPCGSFKANWGFAVTM